MNKKFQEQIGDFSYDAGQAILGAIPAWGPICSYIFGKLVQSPTEERRVKWMNEIGIRLAKIEAETAGFIASLETNDSFLDMLYQASNIAIRNSQQNKLNALKNAVINSALNEVLSYSIKQNYINLIDQLTPLHLQILVLLNNPRKHYKDNNIDTSIYVSVSLRSVILDAFPELHGQLPTIVLFVQDLYRLGLLNTNDVTDITTTPFEPRTSALGKMFILFISEPKLN